jgi:hypothetical protein
VARGATEGSIIAAIIEVHIVTKVINDMPIVPGISPIDRDRRTVTIHAAAATTSKMAVNRDILIGRAFLISE